jgi:hypothetical protein
LVVCSAVDALSSMTIIEIIKDSLLLQFYLMVHLSISLWFIDLTIWSILTRLLHNPGPGAPIERFNVTAIHYLHSRSRTIAATVIIRLHVFQIFISFL